MSYYEYFFVCKSKLFLDSSGMNFLAAATPVTTLALLVLSLRLWTRLVVLRLPGYDDLAICIAMVRDRNCSPFPRQRVPPLPLHIAIAKLTSTKMFSVVLFALLLLGRSQHFE